MLIALHGFSECPFCNTSLAAFRTSPVSRYSFCWGSSNTVSTSKRSLIAVSRETSRSVASSSGRVSRPNALLSVRPKIPKYWWLTRGSWTRVTSKSRWRLFLSLRRTAWNTNWVSRVVTVNELSSVSAEIYAWSRCTSCRTSTPFNSSTGCQLSFRPPSRFSDTEIKSVEFKMRSPNWSK